MSSSLPCFSARIAYCARGAGESVLQAVFAGRYEQAPPAQLDDSVEVDALHDCYLQACKVSLVGFDTDTPVYRRAMRIIRAGTASTIFWLNRIILD